MKLTVEIDVKTTQPRVPAGSGHGGEFASTHGSGGGGFGSLSVEDTARIEKEWGVFHLMKEDAKPEMRKSEAYIQGMENFEHLVPQLGVERAIAATKAVSKYTSSMYGRMNNSLREGKIPKDVELIDDFLKHSKKIDENTTVYRGVKKDFYEGLSKDHQFKDQAFVSTSSDSRVAGGFIKGGGLLEIKGAGGLGVRLPSANFFAKPGYGENEVLLPRNLSFKVVSKEGKNAVVEILK